MSTSANQDGDDGKEEKEEQGVKTTLKSTRKKKKNKAAKKKKASSSKSPADKKELDNDDENNKRRNSLTDSPLTELSHSSAASNGDSADDVEGHSGASCKESSSAVCSSSSQHTSSKSGSYAVNSGLYGDKSRADQGFHFNSFKFKPALEFDDIDEEEHINEVEREYAYEILMGQKRHLIQQLKYNKWTEQLCQTLVTGDFANFLRRFKMIMICLRKRRPNHYQQLTHEELSSLVAQRLVERFHNEEEQTSILMILLGNSDRNNQCSDKDHGFCRIAQMLLKQLPQKQLQKLLEVTAKRSGKTALHLAAATGQSCQLRVLLALTNIDPNRLDHSGRAALHYVIERNNLEMIKQLMWYGADISLCNSEYDPLFLSICANPKSKVNSWMLQRMEALTTSVGQMLRRFCEKMLLVKSPLSPVHFVRFAPDQVQASCQLNLLVNAEKDILISRFDALFSKKRLIKNRAVVFIVPVSFRTLDEAASAADPKLVRVAFPEGTIVSTPMLKTGPGHATGLQPLFHHLHNGFVYAYKLPHFEKGLHTLTFLLKSAGPSAWSRYTLLAVQAYQCVELDPTKDKLD